VAFLLRVLVLGDYWGDGLMMDQIRGLVWRSFWGGLRFVCSLRLRAPDGRFIWNGYCDKKR